MKQEFNNDGMKVMQISPDGTTSVCDDFHSFNVTAAPTTKKGTDINRCVHEVDGCPNYEWEQSLDGEEDNIKCMTYTCPEKLTLDFVRS